MRVVLLFGNSAVEDYQLHTENNKKRIRTAFEELEKKVNPVPKKLTNMDHKLKYSINQSADYPGVKANIQNGKGIIFDEWV